MFARCKMSEMVYVCSKLRGAYELNIQNAKKYARYVCKQGYIPMAPHIYFTQFLDDHIDADRKLGLDFGIMWLSICKELWVFGMDLSEGMEGEIDYAKKNGMKIRYFNVLDGNVLGEV
jgi:hypothetical protein